MKGIAILTMASKGEEIYRRFCQPVCREYSLGPTAFDVMMFLGNNPGYNTARDICRIRGIKSGIASVTVEQLIQSGYLTRQPDERDRRIQRLYPTQQAEPLIAAGRLAQQAFDTAISSALTVEERECFSRLTQKLVEHINRLDRQIRK